MKKCAILKCKNQANEQNVKLKKKSQFSILNDYCTEHFNEITKYMDNWDLGSIFHFFMEQSGGYKGLMYELIFRTICKTVPSPEAMLEFLDKRWEDKKKILNAYINGMPGKMECDLKKLTKS